MASGGRSYKRSDSCQQPDSGSGGSSASSVPANLKPFTIDDEKLLAACGQVQFYDAFVWYAEDGEAFVYQLIKKLEEELYFKLCIPERDLLLGVFIYEASLELVRSSRCRKMLLIITPEFLQSSWRKFLYKFANYMSMEENISSIIPIIYNPEVVVPDDIKILQQLHYNPSQVPINFWTRLAQSINCEKYLKVKNYLLERKPRCQRISPLVSALDLAAASFSSSAAFCTTNHRLPSASRVAGDHFPQDDPAADDYSTMEDQVAGFSLRSFAELGLQELPAPTDRSQNTEAEYDTGYISDSSSALPEEDSSINQNPKKLKGIKKLRKSIHSFFKSE